MNLDEIKDYLYERKQSFDQKKICELEAIKSIAKLKSDEELANEIWFLETVSEIQSLYLDMFFKLKESKYENYYEAWTMLEKIDIDFVNLRTNGYELFDKYYLTFIAKIIKEYEKLFPYEFFASREDIIKKEHCSICGNINTIRNRCEHETGKIYMGEMCCSIVDDMELLGISIVQDPFDKYAVLFPEAKKYNYFMLEELMPKLNTPYDKWYVEIVKEKNPIYRNSGRNDKCPCGSMKKYKKCCLDKEKEYFNHYILNFIDNYEVKPTPVILGSTWKE